MKKNQKYVEIPVTHNSDFFLSSSDDLDRTETVEPDPEKALEEVKNNAKEDLETYKKAADYREAQKDELSKAIAAGKEAIDAARDEAGVASALADAKAAIDRIKTDAQLTEEEKEVNDGNQGSGSQGSSGTNNPENELTDVKNRSKEELEAYKKAADYREAQKDELSKAIAAGKEAIDAVADEAGVSSALAAAKTAIDQIKTDAQLTEEEKQSAVSALTKVKESSKEELETYKDSADYREAQKKELSEAIAAGKKAIDAAVDEAGVNSALADAKAVIDKINTAAQLVLEEQKAVEKTSIKGKPKAKSKSFTVKWKKVSFSAGYQIQYSTSKKFKKKTTKTKTVKKASKTTFTFKKLKAAKRYYVRIRTYKIVDGKKYYSDWSEVKNVKTKK